MPDHVTHTPRIEFEPFADSDILAVRQAIQISRLVNRESGWLKLDQPGTFQRYEMPQKAHQSVRRLADSESLQAYVIHSRSIAAVGLATVIRDQHIIHPTEGKIEGDDLDYWLAAAQPFNTHLAVVEKLCEGQAGRPAFATVPSSSPQAEQRGLSFGEYMRKVGGFAKLTSDTEDRYEVARRGALAQVYQFSQEQA